jgi:hypothetical protein
MTENMPQRLIKFALVLSLAFGQAGTVAAYSANKVWFEFRPTGIFRVYVNYTVPEFKEFREAYVEFRNKKEAEQFYWDLVRGADFYPPDPKGRRFESRPASPEPW